jgi:hypothetical protein
LLLLSIILIVAACAGKTIKANSPEQFAGKWKGEVCNKLTNNCWRAWVTIESPQGVAVPVQITINWYYTRSHWGTKYFYFHKGELSRVTKGLGFYDNEVTLTFKGNYDKLEGKFWFSGSQYQFDGWISLIRAE